MTDTKDTRPEIHPKLLTLYQKVARAVQHNHALKAEIRSIFECHGEPVEQPRDGRGGPQPQSGGGPDDGGEGP